LKSLSGERLGGEISEEISDSSSKEGVPKNSSFQHKTNIQKSSINCGKTGERVGEESNSISSEEEYYSCRNQVKHSATEEHRSRKITLKKIIRKSHTQYTEALGELLRGTTMLKFPRRGRAAPHFKFIQLTRSSSTIHLQWFSIKKPLKTTTINIADMDKVLWGEQTNVYQRFQQRDLAPSAFSIVYNQKYSLDLVAKTQVECKMWVKSLRELIKRAKKHQNLSSLKRIWIKGLDYVNINRSNLSQKGITV